MNIITNKVMFRKVVIVGFTSISIKFIRPQNLAFCLFEAIAYAADSSKKTTNLVTHICMCLK